MKKYQINYETSDKEGYSVGIVYSELTIEQILEQIKNERFISIGEFIVKTDRIIAIYGDSKFWYQ